MSVYFRVKLKNGLDIGRSYICFGTLNRFPWNGGSLNQRFTKSNTTEVEQWLNSTRHDALGQQGEMSYIEFLPKEGFRAHLWTALEQPAMTTELCRNVGESDALARERGFKNYIKEMDNLLKDLPYLKDFVTLQKEEGTVRVHLQGNPCDKVMMALFTFRNLALYDQCTSYLAFREKGCRPRVAFILSCVLRYRLKTPFCSEGFIYLSESESSFVRPETFGKDALMQFIKQDICDTIWHQGTFQEQEGGYYRDEWMVDNGIIFDVNAKDQGDDPDEDYDEYEECDYHGVTYYRHMADTLCIVGDYTPISTEITYSTSCGFTARQSIDVDALLETLERDLECDGISIYS